MQAERKSNPREIMDAGRDVAELKYQGLIEKLWVKS